MRLPPLRPYFRRVSNPPLSSQRDMASSVSPLPCVFKNIIENNGGAVSEVFGGSHGVKCVDSCRVFGRLPYTRGQGSWAPSPCPFPYARRQSSLLKGHRLYVRSTWLKYLGISGILLRFCYEVPQYCYANAYGCIFGLGPGIGGKVFVER